jgi:DNA-binding CsgD family transcriptional regulator
VLHAVLGAYILCFAGGVTLVVLSAFASRRLSILGFRDFALLFTAATFILLVEALKTYERAVASDFGYGLHVAGVLLTLLGNAGVSWFLLSLPLQVIRQQPSRRRLLGYGALSLAVAVLGGVKEAALLFAWDAGTGVILWNVNYLALLGLHVFAGIVLFSGRAGISHDLLRSLVRTILIFFAVFAPLAAAQLVVQDLPVQPGFLRDFPFEQLAYYMGFVIMALVYLAKYFVDPAQVPDFTLPNGFVRKFGISRRESDIVQMMARGFSNRAIAEKLFISSLTVKNHVYHIYQKTGAGNKVQLLNMINSSK